MREQLDQPLLEGVGIGRGIARGTVETIAPSEMTQVADFLHVVTANKG